MPLYLQTNKCMNSGATLRQNDSLANKLLIFGITLAEGILRRPLGLIFRWLVASLRDTSYAFRAASRSMFRKILPNFELHDFAQRANVYATSAAFCRIFWEDMNCLYLLALLLTADHQNAEMCFVAGIEGCMHGSPVFKECARSWSRRMIVKNAVRIASPATMPKNGPTTIVCELPENRLNLSEPLAAITRLEPFERFVFVLSVLERYTDQECSLLLHRTRHDVISARALAIKNLASTNSFDMQIKNVEEPEEALVGQERNS